MHMIISFEEGWNAPLKHKDNHKLNFWGYLSWICSFWAFLYTGCWENCLLTGWALVILSSGEKIKQFFRQGTPAEAEVCKICIQVFSQQVTTVHKRTILEPRMSWSLYACKTSDWPVTNTNDNTIEIIITPQGVQDENSYGALLLAVSEVVHLVRRQTEDIRQMRSLQPSPGRWDQQQGFFCLFFVRKIFF